LCDPELIEQAALKKTSLFTLAERCGIAEGRRVEFVDRFIEHERKRRDAAAAAGGEVTA